MRGEANLLEEEDNNRVQVELGLKRNNQMNLYRSHSTDSKSGRKTSKRSSSMERCTHGLFKKACSFPDLTCVGFKSKLLDQSELDNFAE